MNLTSILSFFGGIGLFLYGMSIMSTGLKNAAGDKMIFSVFRGCVYEYIV